MATLNAITREQLQITIDLMDKMADMGPNVKSLEVNFNNEAAGRLTRNANDTILFIPTHKEAYDPFGR